MKLTIPKKPLKEALTAMSKIVTKSNLPILSAVKLNGTAQGTTVTATNLEETLTYTIKGSTGGGAFIVDLKELKEYLKAGGSTHVQFEDLGPDRMSAIFHTANHPAIRQFKTFLLDDWPVLHSPLKGSKMCENVFASIRKAVPSASHDANRHMLKSVLLEPAAIVATSGKELVKLHCNTGVKTPTAIPVTKFLKAPCFTGPGTISVEELDNIKYCSITTDHWCYTVKCPAGTYPNYKQVITKGSTNCIELSDEDIAYLKKGIPLLETLDDHNTVHLYADSKQIRVLPENMESAGLTVKGTFRGTVPVTISVNRDLLIRCLDLGFSKLAFQVSDGFAPVTASDGMNLFVFMPLRGVDVEKIKEAVRTSGCDPVKQQHSSDKTLEFHGKKPEPQGYTPVTPIERAATADNTQQKRSIDRITKEAAMPEKTKGFSVVGDAEKDPFEELLESIAETRNKAREVLDMTTELSRNVKAAQKAIKAKERDFKSTRDLLSKLKKVSGF